MRLRPGRCSPSCCGPASAGPPSARGRAAAQPAAPGPVILFLIDNSASLPPLDPTERRVTALEKMFSFLQGQRYRLVLFGGRRAVWATWLPVAACLAIAAGAGAFVLWLHLG